jgi:hypothetical protein
LSRRKSPLYKDSYVEMSPDTRDYDVKSKQGILLCGCLHKSGQYRCTLDADKPHIIHVAHDLVTGKALAQWENYG